MPFTYEFARPALTVDCAVFALAPDPAADGPDAGDDRGGGVGGELRVLLVRRGLEPFRGRWALPGGFVRADEPVEAAARRELAEETGFADAYLEQLYTFGDDVRRDPRERVVSVAYYALVNLPARPVAGGTDAAAAAWFPAADPPTLAFDHAAILAAALARLKAKVRYEPVGFELLPPKFTLGQLQRLYEAVLERPLDKRNFRKKVLATGVLVETDEVQQDVAHRAARLYRFDERRYAKLRKQGFNFEV